MIAIMYTSRAFFASCAFLVCLTSINDCWKELKLDVLFAPEEFKVDQNKKNSQSVIEEVDVNAINSTSFQDEPTNENDVTESKFNLKQSLVNSRVIQLFHRYFQANLHGFFR